LLKQIGTSDDVAGVKVTTDEKANEKTSN
jgi:hypothetical protein